MKPITRILRPYDGSAPGMPKARKREPRVKGARRAVAGDEHFDSTLERDVYLDLLRAAQRGWIADLRRQVRFPLLGRDGPILTPTGRPMAYVADFTFTDHEGVARVIDAKGHRTEVYQIKKAILAAQGIEIIEITHGSRKEGTGAWEPNDYRALRDRIVGEGAD